VVVGNGVTAPAKSSPVDQQTNCDESTEDDEDGMKIEVSVSQLISFPCIKPYSLPFTDS